MYDEATFWMPLSVDKKLIDMNELTSTGVELTVIVRFWLLATEYVPCSNAVPALTPTGTLITRELNARLLDPLTIAYELSDEPETSNVAPLLAVTFIYSCACW